MTARWNSPAALGEVSWAHTLAPPEDSPMSVTLPGSPPNAAALSRTQRSAACWSCRPKAPESGRSGWAKKPRAPRRELTVTTVTSPCRAIRVASYWSPEPELKAPPCNHTTTGRGVARAAP